MMVGLLSKLIVAFLLAVSAASTPALACLSSGPDGYTSGLIWRNKPSKIPDNTYAIKIEYVRSSNEGWAFVGKVVDGPKKMKGRIYRFYSEAGHSCVGLGRSKGWMVVRLKSPYSKKLAAVDYEPSTLDWIYSIVTGENWHYPGEPSDPRKFAF